MSFLWFYICCFIFFLCWVQVVSPQLDEHTEEAAVTDAQFNRAVSGHMWDFWPRVRVHLVSLPARR